LAKTEYQNADIDALHSAKELPLVMGRKRKLPMVLRTQKKGELRVIFSTALRVQFPSPAPKHKPQASGESRASREMLLWLLALSEKK
jgi:hypothetical protein